MNLILGVIVLLAVTSAMWCWHWLAGVVSTLLLIWVLRHIRIVTVHESTSVIFKYLGKAVMRVIVWDGHHFDPNGKIDDGDGPTQIGSCWCIWKWGGWVFYLSPFVKPAVYADTNEADNFGNGIYIKLNDITPEPNVNSAETTEADGASVPLDIKFVCTMRIVDPYKWLFVAPRSAMSEVKKRLDSLLRAWVKSGDEKHAQSVKGNGEALWAELIQTPDAQHPQALNCWPTIKKIEDDWGLKIMSNSIIAQDIGYDADYQKAMQAKSLADLTADGDVQATAGRVIKTVAESVGLDVSVLKKKLAKDPSLRGKSASEGGFKEAFAFAEDMVKRDRSPNLSDVRIGGVDGSSLPNSINYLSVGGGGGIGVVANGSKNRQGGKNRKSRKDVNGNGHIPPDRARAMITGEPLSDEDEDEDEGQRSNGGGKRF